MEWGDADTQGMYAPEPMAHLEVSVVESKTCQPFAQARYRTMDAVSPGNIHGAGKTVGRCRVGYLQAVLTCSILTMA